jgi:hypothetical protein
MSRRRTPACGKCGAAKIILRSGASRCIDCHNRWSAEYYRNSSLRRDNQRRSYIKRKYGVSLDDLERLLQAQGERCAICGKSWQECAPAKRSQYEPWFLLHLCVDHDHETGKVRGLLCNGCNAGIGMFEEDLARFESAVAYLRRHAE